MNNKLTVLNSVQGRFGLIFIGLAMSFILLVMAYFYQVLQPRLHSEAQSQASMLTQSLSHALMRQDVLDDAFLLQKEIGKILLYNDSEQERPFIKGITVEFNPDAFPQHNRTLHRGEACDECFKVVTPIYDQSTLILLGRVIFYVNPENYHQLVDEITQRFFFVLLILGALLFVIWLATRKLWQQTLQSQQQLERSNSYNNKILNTMQDMLMLVDYQGRILDANGAAQKQLNSSLAELQTHFIQEYIQPHQKNTRLLKAIKQLDGEGLEVRFNLAEKNAHYGLLSAAPFETEVAEKNHFLIVVKDVHALKMAESKLAYQAQMAHASRLKSLGEMATGIAHEINQPLAVIRLGAEGIKHSLQAREPEAFEVEIAQDVVDQVDRASQIINNMRSFARFQPTPKRWVVPHQPVLSALSFFKEQLRINCINLIEEIDPNCPEILIETQKFEQVIVNMITNARHAVDATSDGRQKIIKVRLMCDHQWVNLSIEDNGIGMDELTRQHCLDPFFTTKETGEGTGLGLSIVHNILQEFGIELMIQSDFGKGSSFILQIPHKMSETE